MNLSTDISGDRAYITISEAIDTLAAEKFLSELDGLSDETHNIDFDLERVSYISSSGLRVLLRAKKIADARGGVVRIVKTSEFVREILTTVGFDKLFGM